MSSESLTENKNKTAVENPAPVLEPPAHIPDTDIYETPEMISILCDMPGVPQENVSITMENNVLSIKGVQQDEPKKGRDMLHCGFVPGVFKRSFSVRADVDVGRIGAKISNGELAVTLPKSDRARPHKIQVRAE